VTIYAVSIAIEAIKADENIDNKRVETILSEMAALANCLLHTSNLTDDNRARLTKIRDTSPEFVEPTPGCELPSPDINYVDKAPWE
jgi:hypothetical protein